MRQLLPSYQSTHYIHHRMSPYKQRPLDNFINDYFFVHSPLAPLFYGNHQQAVPAAPAAIDTVSMPNVNAPKEDTKGANALLVATCVPMATVASVRAFSPTLLTIWLPTAAATWPTFSAATVDTAAPAVALGANALAVAVTTAETPDRK